MKKLLFVALLSLCQFAFSQSKGTVKGIVTDKDMGGEPLPFANVFVKGTSIGSTTDMDGSFSIQVPTGNQTIVFSFVGYETVEKPVNVVSGKTTTINLELGASQGQQLEEVKINATVSKEKESALLVEQKKATVIKESIGAVELSKKGVSNAAAAATKISGVKKSEGSGDVYVRGLGDRYLSTTFNGLPVPSDDVNNKNINLNLFSTGIIQNVGISKTYNTENFSDQASGNVDVNSKEYSKKRYSIGISGGANTNALKIEDFRLTSLHNDNQFTFFTDKGNLVNKMTTQTWKPVISKFPYNYGVSFSASDKISDNLKLASSISYSKSNTHRKGVFQKFNSALVDMSFTDAERFEQQENLTGYLGLKYKINDKNKLKYSGLFVNKAREILYEQGRNDLGIRRDQEPRDIVFMRDQNLQLTQVIINQLHGKHNLNQDNTLTWGAGFNILNAEEPNRILNQINLEEEGEASKYIYANDLIYQQRKSSQNIEDIELNGFIKNQWMLGSANEDEKKPFKLNYGLSIRKKERTFDNVFVGIDASGYRLDKIEQVGDLFMNNNGLIIQSRRPDLYKGKASYYAGFANFDFTTESKISGNIGFRFEHNDIFVDYYVTNVDPGTVNKTYNGVYPSANIKYEINEKNFIRFATSITQTLPEFKEIAPFQYVSPSGRVSKGTPTIEKSDVYNLDLKYELFPSRSELVSATAFYKQIINPINQTIETSAAGDLIYENTGEKAEIYGLEIEGKFDILKNEDDKPILNGNANFTRLWTNQDIKDKFQYGNITESKLQGASDYIVNTSLSYNSQTEKPFIATVTGNYNSDNIFSLGAPLDGKSRATNYNNHIIEKGFVTLDLVMTKKLDDNFTIKLSGKNLLNPEIKQEQLIEAIDDNTGILNSKRTETVQSYTKGVNLSLGVNYQF